MWSCAGQFLDGRPHGWMTCRREYLFDQTEQLQQHSCSEYNSNELKKTGNGATCNNENDNGQDLSTCHQSEKGKKKDENKFKHVDGLTPQDETSEPDDEGIALINTLESLSSDAFVPIEDVVCELDTIDTSESVYSAITTFSDGICSSSRQWHSSLLEVLCKQNGWKSEWNFLHDESNSLSASRIATYEEAFKLSKHPPTVDDVLLLNSKLLHQGPGLLQHTERPAVGREQRHPCNTIDPSPPNCPQWVDEILSKLNSDPIIHTEE